MTKTLRNRIEMQGFTGLSDSELHEIRPWIKFTPAICVVVVGVGMVTQSAFVFATLVPLAALGAILPWHPFDLLYSLVIRPWINGPTIPPYRAPRKFACGVAAVWLSGVFWAFHTGHLFTASILGFLFMVVATLPIMIDLCVPSYLFDFVRKRIPGKSVPTR